MATPNYKPLLNSSENLKALLAEQNAEGITSAVFSGNEPIDVLSAKTIFNAAKSAEDIAGVSSITAGTGISVSGATGAVTISSTVTGTLPTQTGNSGKLLTTDGTNSSWTTTPVATSLTGPAATALTLTGGSSGASLVLGSGAGGLAAITRTVRLNNATESEIQSYTGSVYTPHTVDALSFAWKTSGGTADLTIGTTGLVGITNSTPSTGVGTGALQVAGGIYAGAASVFGGAVTTADAITLNKTGDAVVNLKGGTLGSHSAVVRFGTQAADYWQIGRGPTDGSANFQLYDYQGTPGVRFSVASSTGAATFTGAVAIGNTVAAAVSVASTHKVTMVIGGVTYYLLATNVP